MTATLRCFVATGLAVPLLAASAVAQGNISTQGYGFPQGQLTTRALATGGSIAEIEPTTPLNPGAIGRLTNRTVMFQIEPEYRAVTVGNITERTSTARYPIVFAGVPFGERWVTSLSASSLLDRSWETQKSVIQTIGSDQVGTTRHESANGGINDLRLAEAWSNRSWLSLGLGVHAITGRHTVASGQDFSDSSHFSSFKTGRTISYAGSAVSAGVVLTAAGKGSLGVAYRKGGSLRASANDSSIAHGDVPDHFGISGAFTGIQGTVISARAAHDTWSSMSPMLSTVGQTAHDSWDLGAGLEVAGPRVLSQVLLFRGGARSRTLPFEASGKPVSEKSLSVGSGLSFAGGRVSTDVTGIRQWRDASLATVRERAWTLSISVTARP